MVRTRQTSIPEVTYDNPASLGLEVTTLGALRERAAPGLHLVRPQRPEFHLLMLITAGMGTHMVDFTEHTLAPGSVVWVRPGQVQRFEAGSALQGPLLLFQPDFPPPGTAADSPFGPAHWRLTVQGRLLATTAAQHLAHEYAALTHAPTRTASRLLSHLLAALLHRLVLSSDAQETQSNGGEAFTRFRDAVEREFTTRHRIADYARDLGYSTRTLARATKEAAGLSPKEFLDRRIILEAQRLLAHTDLPAARIGDQLGFPDTTNFFKYFRHHVGVAPGTFRTQART